MNCKKLKSISGVAFFVKNLESFIYGSRFLIFRGCVVRSYVVLFHSRIQIKKMQFPEW